MKDVGPWGDRLLNLGRLGVAALFLTAGVGHFTQAPFFIEIVPDWIPWPAAAVYVSGVAEILGGLGVLHPKTRRAAGWGLLALLVAVYPANIDMALHPKPLQHAPEWMGDPSLASRWARLPVQFLFMAWVWVCTLRRPRSAARKGRA